MAGKSTNIHVSGFTFPGKMHDYYWQYPTVSVPKKGNGKLINTTFYVGVLTSPVAKSLVSTNMNVVKGAKPNPSYNPNFSFKNFAVKLNQSMLDHSPLNGHIAFYVTSTQQGDGHTLFRDITFVNTGKSLGRKNQTNVFTQALADVLSKYTSKSETMKQKKDQLVTPMLAEGEGLSGRDDVVAKLRSIISTHAVTGVYMQPKYDGVRVMSMLNLPDTAVPFETTSDVICYSRNGKPIMVSDHLLHELREIMTSMMERHGLNRLILDGEYYYHGMPLQSISGYARGSSQSDEKDKINLIIYDLYDGTDKAYTERYDILNQSRDLFDVYIELDALMEGDTEIGHVLISETSHFTSLDDMIAYYDKAIADNYEGAMVRLPESVYESCRSRSLIKVKPLISYEYECVGYDFGKGKDSDIPTIRCRIGEKGVKRANEWWQHRTGQSSIDMRRKDNEFSAKFVGLNEADQRKLGEEFKVVEPNGKTRFENHYLGRQVTIKFLDYSTDGKPEKPNCEGFR